MRKVCTLLALTIIVFYSNISNASHIMGGNISYEWISGNIYRITMHLYRDCAGINAPLSADLCISSQQGGYSFTTTLNLMQTTDISMNCASVTNNCNGGSLLGIEKYTYSDIVTLPGNYPDWILSWISCCRNGAIVNIPGATSSYYIESRLDNQTTPFNNSVLISNEPVFIVGVNQPLFLNHEIYDADGDSLYIELMPALERGYNCIVDSVDTISYLPGYSYLQPVSSSVPMTINHSTGELTLTPNAMGTYVVRYRVREFRNGIQIGSMDHDFQIIVLLSNNQAPDISGFNNGNTYVMNACAGDTLLFSLQTNDPDAGDSTFVFSHSLASLPYSVSTIGGGLNQSVAVEIITDSSDIQSYPHLLFVRANDNHCPIKSTRIRMYQIYVNQCISNDVWPGDANSDLVANMYDILPIGLAYGSTGPVRAGANISWTAQPATAWGQTIASGMDYKHVDCDGNGVIDSSDYVAISSNYGMTHARIGQNENITSLNGHDLAVSFSSNVAAPGQYITASFDISNVSGMVNNVYGLVFTLNVHPQLMQNNILSFDRSNSWLSNASGNGMLRTLLTASGQTDIGLVRIDHNNVSGSGSVLECSFTINPLINQVAQYPFTISNIRLVDASGVEYPVNGIGGVLTVDPRLGVSENISANDWNILPNPVRNILVLEFDDFTFSEIQLEIVDTQGRIILKTSANNSSKKQSLDVSFLSKGMYCIRITHDKEITSKTFIKL